MTGVLRIVLACALLVVPARAAELIYLGTDGIPQETNTISRTGSNNALYCADLIPPIGITNATKLAFRGGVAVSNTVGIAVYTHAGACPETGSCALVSTTFAGTIANDTLNVVTGLSAFSIPDGTGEMVRVCHCRSGGASNYRAAINVSTDVGTLRTLWNALAVHAGLAVEACSAGTPPGFTGTLSDDGSTNAVPPLLAIGK